MIELHPDTGTVSVTLPSGEVVLRWPTVAEWADIADRYIAAELEIETQPEEERAAYRRANAPFAAAFAHMIALLSDLAEPDAQKLPRWADDVNVFLAVRDMWTTCRISTAATPDVWSIPDPDATTG